MIDYKELLVKYIKHVEAHECVNFLEPEAGLDRVFTPEELAELRLLAGDDEY